jgi:hypothetical protein
VSIPLNVAGKAVGTLEVENRGLDPTLPKSGRFSLAVNACTSRGDTLLGGKLHRPRKPACGASLASRAIDRTSGSRQSMMAFHARALAAYAQAE